MCVCLNELKLEKCAFVRCSMEICDATIVVQIFNMRDGMASAPDFGLISTIQQLS